MTHILDYMTQKLAGHLALDITSLDKAKRLFQIETDSLAGFCSAAGLFNRRTSAREEEKLRLEMQNSQHPLVLTDLLREVMNLPSPPPISPGTPPPEVRARIKRLDRLARETSPSRPPPPWTPRPHQGWQSMGHGLTDTLKPPLEVTKDSEE